jgi:selenocysteine lyase/cysteine desulfurase
MTITIEKIRSNVIGEGHLINTVFGLKPLVYADYTASGRSLAFVEKIIEKKVLPLYANTHSESSITGKQTSRFREQARAIIHKALNTSVDHKVIFTGSGATSAINKLIDMLNLRLPAELDAAYQFDQQITENDRPVVFIGPYEHHSNELPWRESIAQVVTIPLDGNGLIDLQYLEQMLKKYQQRKTLIGSFSAASNVTGVKTKVSEVSKVLHKYGALSCWDYAAAAPYVGIDMSEDELDAVFISTHKFIGGPGTPGLLVVDSKILTNSVPAIPGGGTVMYVSPEHHTFVTDIERREEGGTPAAVESIRAGLVFEIQSAIGTKTIERLESGFIKTAIKKLSELDNFTILGSSTAARLSILSFNISHNDQVLHYGFVVALLNDLFGIQARGGCSCAGPYGHQLLDLSMERSLAIEAQLHQGHMVLRPGWVRLNFNYFIDQQTFDYIVNALTLITEHGWRLLAHYQYDKAHGTWQYIADNNSVEQHSEMQTLTLSDLLLDETITDNDKIASSAQLQQYLELGQKQLLAGDTQMSRTAVPLCDDAQKLRWFV